MTTQRRLTVPGMNDNEFMTVTCTPDKTAVEFFEFEHEAIDAARVNLHPTTTTYVGNIIRQGEHAMRGSSRHLALLVEVDSELRKALLREFGARSRADQVKAIDGILRGALAALVGDHEVTQPDLKLTRDVHGSVTVTDGVKLDTAGYRAHVIYAAEVNRAHAEIEMEAARLDPNWTPARPPAVSCHPGNRCTNWPQCEHCGPARL